MSERTETSLCDMTPSLRKAWLSSLSELDSERRSLCQFASYVGLEIESNDLEALSRALVTAIRSSKTAYFIEFFKLLCSHPDTSIDELESSITQLAHIAAVSMIAIPSRGDGPQELKFDRKMHKNKDHDGHGVRALMVLSQGKQAFDLGILLNDSEVLESVAKNIAIDKSFYGDADTDAALDLFYDKIAQALKVTAVKPVKPQEKGIFTLLTARENAEYEAALAAWRETVIEQLDLKNDELVHHALDSNKLPLAFGTIEADDQLIQEIHTLMPGLPLFVFNEQSGRQLVFPKLSTSFFASFLKELLLEIQQQVQTRQDAQAKALQSEDTKPREEDKNPQEAERQDNEAQPPQSLKQKAEDLGQTAKAIGNLAAKTGKAVEQGGDLVDTVVDTAKDVAPNLPDLPI